MASFYRATVEEFLSQSDEEILARLSVGYANRGYTTQYSDQTLTWVRDISFLRRALKDCVLKSESAKFWGVLLEFSIPRKEKRIDIVLLVRDVIVILEAKTGRITSGAQRQVEEYALLLHYFHRASAESHILPTIVSEVLASQGSASSTAVRDTLQQISATRVHEAIGTSWRDVTQNLIALENHTGRQIVPECWDTSPYFPVPSIFEAAIALKSGLSIREIAHSEASEHEIEDVQDTIQAVIAQARAERQHAICFLTGVPGSGKTLIGLSLAHSSKNPADAIHFMSGNGPLVRVLQHLLTQESMRAGARSAQARAEAKTLIENVHVFARYHTEDNPGPPSNHAVIFDEAQRAWNQAQNKKKFGRDYSEPEMLLRIMERHSDWAVVIALVGGGQEINDGEAGLEEWGRALVRRKKCWIVHACPEVLEGGSSTANHRLFSDAGSKEEVRTSRTLHLRTSNRSLRAEKLAEWVNFVLEGDAKRAAALKVTARFPILLSRSVKQTRSKLRETGIGVNRYGLIGSSGAARLRAEGLEPSSSFHADYKWEHWYRAGEQM